MENQVEMCRRYIAGAFSQIGEGEIRVYEDEGFSGGSVERPQFQKMMADAQAGAIGVIVCYRLDRISRNIGDFARLIERLSELDIAFLSIKEQFDTSNPLGRAMMYISSVFSQLERETIAERIKDNMYELAKTGRWLGGVTPMGYCSAEVCERDGSGRTKRFFCLRERPEEAETVRALFGAFRQCGSLTGTQERLEREGRRTKNGRPFTRVAVKNILQNPVYAAADGRTLDYFRAGGAGIFAGEEAFDGRHGVMAYNRTLQRPGKTNRIRPMGEWIIAVGGHGPLVSGGEWTQVQRILAENRERRAGGGNRGPRRQGWEDSK